MVILLIWHFTTNKNHKDSAKIAQNLPFHMIHFSTKASSSFKGEEIDTLKITDSYETIEKELKQLRVGIQMQFIQIIIQVQFY